MHDHATQSANRVRIENKFAIKANETRDISRRAFCDNRAESDGGTRDGEIYFGKGRLDFGENGKDETENAEANHRSVTSRITQIKSCCA